VPPPRGQKAPPTPTSAEDASDHSRNRGGKKPQARPRASGTASALQRQLHWAGTASALQRQLHWAGSWIWAGPGRACVGGGVQISALQAKPGKKKNDDDEFGEIEEEEELQLEDDDTIVNDDAGDNLEEFGDAVEGTDGGVRGEAQGVSTRKNDEL
jgi:hypothetical protein